MNKNFLEVLYYIASIIASSGIVYKFFKNFIVSRYEIIFLNVFQRKICKLYCLIKNISFNIFGISIIFFVGCTRKIISIMIMDFIIYLIILYLYDFPYLFYQKIQQIICCMKLDKKETTILCKVAISLLMAFFSYAFLKIFGYMFVFFQVIFLIYFLSEYIKRCNILKFKKFFSNECNKNEYMKSISLFIISLFCIKLLIFYNKNEFINYKINNSKLTLQYIQKFMYNIWMFLKNEELYIIIGFLFISIFLAYYNTYNRFNIKAIIWYENKSWEILYITGDNYALCSFDNLNLMIKTETIKTDYYCIVINGTYQFYEKSKNKNFLHSGN